MIAGSEALCANCRRRYDTRLSRPCPPGMGFEARRTTTREDLLRIVTTCVAEHGQRPLPFGDARLDGDVPERHGTNLGLQRHSELGDPPCEPCAALIAELVDAGLARPIRSD